MRKQDKNSFFVVQLTYSSLTADYCTCSLFVEVLRQEYDITLHGAG